MAKKITEMTIAEQIKLEAEDRLVKTVKDDGTAWYSCEDNLTDICSMSKDTAIKEIIKELCTQFLHSYQSWLGWTIWESTQPSLTTVYGSKDIVLWDMVRTVMKAEVAAN